MSILVFILGMCAGSFVNMLVYRTAKKYQIKGKGGKIPARTNNRNRSFCDYCGRQLTWYENIPVVSWLIQRGKSRCCDNPLPWEYPVIEIITGLLFLLNFQFSVIPIVIITMLVFSAVFDAKFMILPDFSTVILIIGAVILLIVGREDPRPYLLAAAIGPLFLGILHIITKGKGMGLGDVKLAIFMGLLLGIAKLVVAFYVAFFTGAVVGLILMAIGKKKRKSLIAFGPFLIFGTLVSWWWGERILEIVSLVL